MEPNSFATANPAATQEQIDQGLKTYLLSIYNKMTMALAVTGAVAYWASSALLPMMQTPLWIVMALLPLAFILVLSFGIDKFSVPMATAVFYLFAVSMGISLSTIFVLYTTTSIAKVFFISAATFAAASIYGYTTQRDLTSMGSFLIMGAVGIFIAGIVNIFLQSSLMSFVISCIAVLVFTGLTAYDSQQLKEEYMSQGAVYGFDSAAKSSIFGALTLYLDFINIFVHLMNLIGDRK
jgi:FtsH-binding integral membrane protein